MRRAATAILVIGLGLVSCSDDADTVEDAAPSTTTTALATTTTAPAATTTRAAATMECDTVGFTPNSEDAASEIRATGLTCDEARTFVGVAGRRTSSGGPPQVDVAGYRCVRTRTEQEPLPRSFYECTNGMRKVTFVRS